MTRVEALGGIVYDIFRLPVEREEALEGLARQNTPEAIDIIAEVETVVNQRNGTLFKSNTFDIIRRH